MVMIFFTSSSLHLIVCQQLKLSMCAVYQSMLSCPKPKRHRFTMFMSRKFGSRSNRLAGYKGYLLGWNQLGNNKMSLQTDPRQINLKLFIQYQNIMLNLQLYHFSYVIMYNNYVIRRLHIIKLQLIINRGKYISKLATDWLRCVLFFFCHLSLLCTTRYIRPFSVVQEGSYKVRKKGMQTNLTDFFSSFRKVFSRFFLRQGLGEKEGFYQNQLSQICIARVINQSLRTIQWCLPIEKLLMMTLTSSKTRSKFFGSCDELKQIS